MIKRAFELTYHTARRIVVTAVGVTVILIGLAMVVLPGPATLVIPLGLAILGIEFAWARRWLRRIEAAAQKTVHHIRDRRSPPPGTG